MCDFKGVKVTFLAFFSENYRAFWQLFSTLQLKRYTLLRLITVNL